MNNHDLFGEIPVTLREVELWLYKVPRMAHYERRAAYAHGWNVVAKIRAAKREGTLENIFGDQGCEFCGQTLCAEQAVISAPTHDELARLRRRLEVLEFLLRVPTTSVPRARAARLTA